MNAARTIIARYIASRLESSVRALAAAEEKARHQLSVASLTSVEALVPEQPPHADAEHEFLLALDRDIAEAVARADEAEARWSPAELAKFRTPSQRLNECVEAVRHAVRRVRETIAVGVFALAVLAPTAISREPMPAQEQQEEASGGHVEVRMPNLDIQVGWLADLPQPGQTRISQWPDGEISLSRDSVGPSPLSALDEVQRQTADAILETVASLPPDLAEMLHREALINSGGPEMSMHGLVATLDHMREKGDTRADRFVEIMSALTQRLDDIQEANDDALEPLMGIFGPARELTDVGLKDPRGLKSAAGQAALLHFSEAMARIGVRVEYKPGT